MFTFVARYVKSGIPGTRFPELAKAWQLHETDSFKNLE